MTTSAILSTSGLRVPDYDRSLAAVLPSLAAALGLPGYLDTLGLGHGRKGSSASTVIVLVDGLGYRQLAQTWDAAPFLASLQSARSDGTPHIDAAFPTTTATGLTSLGTASSSGQHGLVGMAFELPGFAEPLRPLGWRDSPPHEAVRLRDPMLAQLDRSGVDTAVVNDAQYQGSGLSDLALTAGRWLPAQEPDDLIQACREATRRAPSVVYTYWSGLDRVGHVEGWQSAAWQKELRAVDQFARTLAEAMPSGCELLITADHGMVDCAETNAVELDDWIHHVSGVRSVLGEPRMRHIYTRGDPHEVAAVLRHRLDGAAIVLTRAEAIHAGLFGAVVAEAEERIGDVLLLATDTNKLTSRHSDSFVSALVGQHGSATPDELEVPLLLYPNS